ncbi:MAG TPA: class I SAM-dependent methyltransferase [Usitatibacter sp.]|nr:class I SAM-dependent methyltransferase [Usitatibacter sp.]
MTGAFYRTLARDAARRYPPRDRYARHFAFGKLTRDPAFRALLERGLLPREGALLDLGCGQGVLVALLLAARESHARGDWPQGWSAPPNPRRMRGIDWAPRDVLRARQAAGADAEFIEGDIRSADFGRADTVVALDVLHYIDFPAQEVVLARVRAALEGGGVLLLRVANASRSLRFHFTVAMDRLAMAMRGQRFPRLWSRPAAEWRERLAALGFAVEDLPMSEGTPFANVLLVARYHPRTPAPSSPS